MDEQTQYVDSNYSRLSIPTVYDKIKRSNSSLNRKSKKLLEDSISRVLEVLKQDAVSDDEVGSMEGDFDEIEIAEAPTANGINKSIVGLWAQRSAKTNGDRTPMTDTQGTQPTASVSKKRQHNGEPLPKKRKAAPVIDHSPPTHI